MGRIFKITCQVFLVKIAWRYQVSSETWTGTCAESYFSGK